jgi:AcrR family transcriptional regulator
VARLIDPERRERARLKRSQRRTRILEEARSTFARLPFVEVTLDHIGQRAGVERGVASMYFGSREGLFLLLLREELDAWYNELVRRLQAVERPVAKAAAGLAVESLVARSLLARLLSLAPVVLEQNMEALEVFHFQRWRRDRMAEVGDALERAGGLDPGAGFRLLYLLQLLTAGLEPAANPRGAAAFDHADPEFASLKVSLEGELKRLLEAAIRSSSGDPEPFDDGTA